ncbi:Pupal cuticle protein, partial [Pseudolycoriella hygida]
MKLLICCMLLIASSQALSFARDRDANARILRADSDSYPDGSYQYGYEADNGIEVEESGVAGVSVSGSAKWVDEEGTPIELTYTADENGYRPQGAHLP